MSKWKLHNIVIILGIVFWFAETAYFGFNIHPSSDLERCLDNFSLYVIFIGIILGFINKPKITNITINIDEKFVNDIRNFCDRGF